MKILFLGILAVLCSITLKGQKQAIQIDSYKKWTRVNSGVVSNDGKFVSYVINNIPIGSNTLVLKSTETDDKTEFRYVSTDYGVFTDDSQNFLAKLPNDTLLVFNLKTRRIRKIPSIRSFELIKQQGKSSVVLIDTSSNLTICNFNKFLQKKFSGILSYKINPSGDKIILKRLSGTQPYKESLVIVDLISNAETVIFDGNQSNSYIFDDSGNQVAFLVNDGTVNLWYYNIEMKHAIKLSQAFDTASAKKCEITKGQCWGFNSKGTGIFFGLKKKYIQDVKVFPEELEVSSYEDAYLRTYWKNIKDKLPEYLAIIDIRTKEIKQLTHENEEILMDCFTHKTDSTILIRSSHGDNEIDAKITPDISYFICNSRTGQKKPLEVNVSLNNIKLSPTGNYVVYFDPRIKNYCSYCVNDGQKQILTSGIKDSWINYEMLDYPRPEEFAIGISGWLPNDRGVLLNSTYEIWCVDPSNKTKAINLTNGKGAQTNTLFKPLSGLNGAEIGQGGTITLAAFNLVNKDFGFYEVKLSPNHALRKLSMTSYYCGNLENGYPEIYKDDVSKSLYSNSYLLKFQRSNKAPNYYYSKDLIKFTQLSDVQPQREYSWLKSELHNYKDSLGNQYQGVLYKPESFDSSKVYPIIFQYYITKSNMLNSYPEVDMGSTNINIPLMVSNDYLVFLPDIKSKNKYSGDGAVTSLDAAADHLAKYRWVNQKKIGINGSSFGGFETNYIVTHSTRYAAALSGAGSSNMISFASGIWGWGSSQQTFAKYSATKMGSSLSEDLEPYIRNSPILYANEMNTPLLLVHNTKDPNVNYLQTQSFFMVLRNLQKKVWWLNYKNQGHGIDGEDNVNDFNTRIIGFFDHYLKDKPIPKWMKEHL